MKTTVKSVVHPDYVRHIVGMHYPHLRKAACQFLQQGRNDTYLLEGAGSRYFFRIARASHRTVKQLCDEVRVLNFLHSKGLRVCKPVATTSGRWVVEVPAPEGPRPAVLFEGMMGQSRKNMFTAQDSNLFGSACSELHKALDEYPAEGLTRPVYGLEYLLDWSMVSIEGVFCRTEELGFLVHLHDELKAQLTDSLRSPDLKWGICHGDLNSGNALFFDGYPSFLDFDDLCFSCRMYDISCFLWDLYYPIVPQSEEVRARRNKCYDSFLQGYCSTNQLNLTELLLAKHFVLLRDLWLLRLHAERREFEGSHRYSGQYLRNSAYNIKLHLAECRRTLA